MAQPDNFARLRDLVGFDPTRKQHPTTELLARVKGKITEKREAAAEEAAEKIIEQAMGLAEQASGAEKQFNQNKAKWNKELGKLLNNLQGGGGKPQEEPADDTPESTD